CEPGSHYESCAPPCPATCSNANPPAGCNQQCAEGCVCDDGFVLSGDKCVPTDQCGCLDNNGHYHPIGENWFESQDCSQRCICVNPGNVNCGAWVCEDDETCGVEDGILGCHGSAPGDCVITGDPHYITFDKTTHHFMGECTYTAAIPCNQSSTLPHFNVETTNEFRGGSTAVSYVKEVHVDVYGHRFTLAKGRRVLVDGLRVTPPFFMSGVYIQLSGSYVVLETDFNLVVRFDGNHHVEIVVPGEYAGQLCGICGNFNGDGSDDNLKPDGSAAASSSELGNSWRVFNSSDDDCQDDTGEIPPCDENDKNLYESDTFCGIINDPEGAFKECHAVLPPQIFFDNCVFDLCATGGDHGSLCQALQAYADQCAQAGVIVTWRNNTFCPFPCEPGSHYESCAPPCPATCSNANPPAGCNQQCAEGCVCDDGFVLSGDKCVPTDQCGCLDNNGYYHPIGESWFESQDCSQRCICVNPGNVNCGAWVCEDDETCGVEDGILGCHGSAPGDCVITGDPHYITFDKTTHHFMGECTYTAAIPCNQSSTLLPHFNVETTNEFRGGSTAVSYVKEVHVDVYGHRFTLAKGRRVLVDGLRVTPPFFMSGVYIQLSGSYVVLETDFNLVVRFDGNHHVEIVVPGEYAGQLCGICGNFNGDGSDDNLKPDGSAAASSSELGNSWRVFNSSDDDCQDDTGEIPPCDENDKNLYESDTFCGIITDPEGAFKECHAVLPPQVFFDNCVFDLCATGGDHGSLCQALQAYADQCAQAGVIVTWRNNTFCPFPCEPGSHYESCAPPCPATCSNASLPGGCNQQCAEGCVCDDGFVLSGDKCVPTEQCGCLDNNGHYHPLGESWFESHDCSKRCICVNPGGNVSCDAWVCKDDEICSVVDGILGCHTQEPGDCVITGDPHYITFDKTTHHFMGECTYTAAVPCNQSSTLPHFNVETTNEFRGGSTAVSYVKDVHVDVYGHRFTLAKGRRVLVDGLRVTPPFFMSGVYIQLSGSYVVLETDFNLVVRFDGNHHVEIVVPGEYAGQLCGICGNFNGDGSDDNLKPDGSAAASSNELGNSWRVFNSSDDDCQDGTEEIPPCDENDKDVYESDSFCGIITDPEGAFKECHAVLPPQVFFDNCVFDLCATGGDHGSLCQALQAYADQCAQAGVIVTWRNNTFCPFPCEPGSHYESCAPPCPATCSNASLPGGCNQQCAEGCVCDDGFVLSGDKCVPVELCGCLD
uniref:VWFD domain-containing protein n=1 Tax=Petromyzon marinus TaxID=7757 RepID=S4R6Z7_PETMA